MDSGILGERSASAGCYNNEQPADAGRSPEIYRAPHSPGRLVRPRAMDYNYRSLEFGTSGPEPMASSQDPTFSIEPGSGAATLSAPTTESDTSVAPLASGFRYSLGLEIARGGMGVVYRALDTHLGREVAVKVLQDQYSPHSKTARRFADEARITAQLQHPGIPPVHDFGTLPDGRPFLAMKLIKGDTLEAMLKDRSDPTRDRGRYVAVFEQICHALAYAHSHAVIHRDLKPSNIMVGNFGEVQVMDWGLAKVLGPATATEFDPDETTAGTVVQSDRDSDGSFTQTGSVLGTPAFMPPEQALGAIAKIDRRSDVFGLGGILAAILTGKPPYAAESLETTRIRAAQGKTEDCFARLDACGADPELAALCKRCLQTEPAGRPSEAGDVARAVAGLRQAAEERVRQVEFERVRSEERRKRRRTQLILATAAIGLIAAIGYGATAAALWQRAVRSQGDAETARGEAEAARERLAAVEYGRTMQVAYREWLDNNAGATNQLLAATRPDLRGWEYHYLDALCHHDLLTLRGHTGWIDSAVFSPDGKRVATRSNDGTARIWNAETGAETFALKLPVGGRGSVSFSPDGAKIFTTEANRTARIWDAKTGTEIRNRTFDGGPDRDDAFESSWFSPDGARIVTRQADGRLRAWEVQSGTELFDFENAKGPAPAGEELLVTKTAFSRDGSKFLAVGWNLATRGGSVRVWDAKTGASIQTARELPLIVVSAAYSPDGSRIALTGFDRRHGDGTVSVLDAETGAELLLLSGHKRTVGAVSFSADGTRIATGARDGTARVWDAETGHELLVLKGHAGNVDSIAFSPDGARLVTAGRDGTARIWDARNGSEVPALQGHGSEVLGAAYIGESSRVVTAGQDGTARVWDGGTGKELKTWAFGNKRGGDKREWMAFSPDGTRVASRGERGKVEIRYSETGEELTELKGIPEAVSQVAFNADGSRIATVGTVENDAKLRIWDARTGAELLAFTASRQGVRTISFSRDSTRLLTTDDGVARIWDAASGAEVVAFPISPSNSLSAFSPDGTRIVTGGLDGAARIWDAKTGSEISVLRGHTGSLDTLAYSPDGTRLVTGGEDATARVWDARTGVEVLFLKGHGGGVLSARFSPDGAWIVTASGDRTARLWGVRPLKK